MLDVTFRVRHALQQGTGPMMDLYVVVRREQRLAGFGYGHQVYDLETYRAVRVPDWFTATLPLPLTLCLWRRGRARAGGGGFDARPA